MISNFQFVSCIFNCFQFRGVANMQNSTIETFVIQVNFGKAGRLVAVKFCIVDFTKFVGRIICDNIHVIQTSIFLKHCFQFWSHTNRWNSMYQQIARLVIDSVHLERERTSWMPRPLAWYEKNHYNICNQKPSALIE